MGKLHPAALSAAESVAFCLMAVDRHEEALPLLKRVTTGREAAGGAGPPHLVAYVKSATMLADCMDFLGQRAEAIEQYEKNVAACEAMPPTHTLALANLSHYADALYMSNRFDAALEAYTKSCDRRAAAAGATAPLTLKAVMRKGDCCYAMGRYQDAADCYRVAYQARLAALGAGHAETKEAEEALASCAEALTNKRLGRVDSNA